jgi:hypothetical protein
MQAQATTHTAGTLWFLEITALAFVAIGVFLLMVEPAQWLLGVSSIVLFGLSAAMIARLLVLRHRAMGASGAREN